MRLSMSTALRLTAVIKAEVWASAAAVLLCFASASAEEQKTYWDLATFQELSALVPELAGARPRGLAPGGMELWTQNQLRLPETPSTVLRGEFRQPGRVDCAVLLEVGEPGKARTHLLISSCPRNCPTKRERKEGPFFNPLNLSHRC